MDALAAFHPAVRTWFERRFAAGPTEPQRFGWPAIAEGRDTLIAAPTGTGKTLSAFLVCIDRLFRGGQAESEEPFRLTPSPGPRQRQQRKAAREPACTEVIYVSPLKALAADIHHNLEEPLAEIRQVALELGYAAPELRVALRTGDTPASARAAMLRRPPHLLVTTPESLYLLLTAEKSRAMLRGVRTLIVDEIHALARDKRGSHLALSLERLDELCEQRPVRIGLSATQRPVETVARLLVGAGPDRSEADGSPRCTVVDVGHRRELDLCLELPESELEAVASGEQLAEVLDRIAERVREHRTTLIFVNTRRLAERLAHMLADRLGEEGVAAHHGSLSRERRLRVEAQLRAGELRALVATASLELGIDVGPVELVCQIGSPRGLSTFIQRVGRSGHHLGGIPKGVLFPLTRDELVECAALLHGVRAGELDALMPPRAPLDILAQQIVASCAAESCSEDELFAWVRRAAPFSEISRDDFDEILEMLSEGITTGRGRRGAYLHRDRVHGLLRARRGARIAAVTSGGAIPETADYRVVADPDDTFVGTVDEDWAIESMAGDIFLLGSTSWKIRRVESGVVRVVDAGGAPPTVPFWMGEAPARSEELSREVSDLRERVGADLASAGAAAAAARVAGECGLSERAARELVNYLDVSRTALGTLPTRERVVFERFFDEAGGMQLVVHSPAGGRLNRALGLALRKRFCRRFDFELQAAANDDAVVLSLGPQHSFPLQEVPGYLKSDSVEDVLSQALLASPMFTARWRWNLNRALVVLRNYGGKRNPPAIQRMQADDMMAAVFPGLAACQENVAGPVEIPDHPLVRQTLYDCLHEAMDVDALKALVAGFEKEEVALHFVDTTEPSPLAHEILSARPYTFLDDAPLEERRTRAVQLRRGLPVAARELARLDPEAIARVESEVQPEPRDADELHDWLLVALAVPPREAWRDAFEELVAQGRACALTLSGVDRWCAAERLMAARALWPGLRARPELALPPALQAAVSAEDAAFELLAGQLDASGPRTARELVETTALGAAAVAIGLARLEAEGLVLRGHFRSEEGDEEFCARRLLERIHRYTKDRLRREIQPVTAQDFMRFLLRWQHVAPGTQGLGRQGVLAAVEQLQGFEVAAGDWEQAVLPARVEGYRSEWLDALCLSGEVTWARVAPRAEGGGGSPSRASPLSLLLREDLPWLLRAARGEQPLVAPQRGAAQDVLACLRERGALFHRELVTAVGHLPVEVEEGLWELVARGHVTADGVEALRGLLGARSRWERRVRRQRARRGLRRGARSAAGAAEGRWSLLPEPAQDLERESLAEAVAEQLLARWGVVVRDVVARENLAVPWRELSWAFRRLEARGSIRGGRFVTGFTGEQFALPAAVEGLRATRRRPRSGERIVIAATDPLNLTGVLCPGPRVPAHSRHQVTYVDGSSVEASLPGSHVAR